jgi:hypothetical protein
MNKKGVLKGQRKFTLPFQGAISNSNKSTQGVAIGLEYIATSWRKIKQHHIQSLKNSCKIQDYQQTKVFQSVL